MKISQVLSGAGLTALAATLAIAAVPAAAQDRGQRQARDGSSNASEQRVRVREERSAGRADRAAAPQRTETRPPRSEPRAAPPPQPTGQRAATPSQQPPVRSGWAARGSERNPDGANQRNERERARSDRAGETSRPGAYAAWTRGAAGVQQAGRNPTYVDPNRNTTYRDGRRDNDRGSRDGRRDNDRASRDGRRDNDRDWRGDRRDNDRDWRDNRRDNDRDWSDGRRDDRQWDRRWRDDNRYDWRRWRDRNRTAFRIGTYYAPYRHYYYRRLSVGLFLDSLFYSDRYWISDPWRYRLPEVYGPYRWVRYYDDALLIDIYSGEVVDVIYDFFW